MGNKQYCGGHSSQAQDDLQGGEKYARKPRNKKRKNKKDKGDDENIDPTVEAPKDKNDDLPPPIDGQNDHIREQPMSFAPIQDDQMIQQDEESFSTNQNLCSSQTNSLMAAIENRRSGIQKSVVDESEDGVFVETPAVQFNFTPEVKKFMPNDEQLRVKKLPTADFKKAKAETKEILMKQSPVSPIHQNKISVKEGPIKLVLYSKQISSVIKESNFFKNMALTDLMHKYMSSISEDLKVYNENYPAELATTTLIYLNTLKLKTEQKMQYEYKNGLVLRIKSLIPNQQDLNFTIQGQFGVNYDNSSQWFEPSFILDLNKSKNAIYAVNQEIILTDEEISNFKIVLKIEGQEQTLSSEDIYSDSGKGGICKEIININDQVTLNIKHQRVMQENVQQFKDTQKLFLQEIEALITKVESKQ